MPELHFMLILKSESFTLEFDAAPITTLTYFIS